MKLLCCHPSGLMYTEIYLRLEPLGLELTAAAARAAGHDVRLLDLQTCSPRDYIALIDDWRPDAVGFGLNYLANIPEVVDLARATKARLPGCLVFAGGHSASFTAPELLAHAAGSLDCVVKGEAEEITPLLLDAALHDRRMLHRLPGVCTPDGEGPAPTLVKDLDRLRPARDLLRRRRKYFIGVLDPAASIEFSRGCPWDCSFCSAWTFYGRSYRLRHPQAVAEELQTIREPGVFITDDVAFIQAEQGFSIGKEIEKRGIRKEYYLETRGDVLLRNRDVFAYWTRLGLRYMFLGLEAIDEEGLLRVRKRVTLSKNYEALEVARALGLTVAVNIIADPSWDRRRFAAVRDWALDMPEIVNISVNTPYPGTESFQAEASRLTTRDYRLFDIQHAVLPTALPLEEFYRELVATQRVLNMKHLGVAALRKTAWLAARLLLQGQTNFVRMLWKFNGVYNPERQLADHRRPVVYQMAIPAARAAVPASRESLYVLSPNGARQAAGRPLESR